MVDSGLSFVFCDPLLSTQMFANTQLAGGGKFGGGSLSPRRRALPVTHSGRRRRGGGCIICLRAGSVTSGSPGSLASKTTSFVGLLRV